MAKPPPAPEFARAVDPPHAVGKETAHRIEASPAERVALAARFDLVALDRLDAEVRLRLLTGGMVRLDATLIADVVQSCIATLEPVPGHVEDTFTLLFGPGSDGGEVVLDGAAETVEPFDGGRIDIGEAVAQQLSLALDPFPRAPDAME